MKKTAWFFLVFICFLGKITAQSILEKKVNLVVTDTPLKIILDSLAFQSEAQFSFDQNRIPGQKSYSLKANNLSLQKALQQLFDKTNIQFKANKNYLVLFRDEIPYYTISGYIRDKASGEALIEANLFDTQYFRGCSSNEYGFYSLSLPEGTHLLKGTYVGYQEQVDTLKLYTDIQQDILLQAGNDLVEILVLANPTDSTILPTLLKEEAKSGITIAVEKAQSLPTFLGERDVLKYLQLLPGVVAGGLAGNNLYIRGGSLDQNLILLDDVPIYNVNHLFGVASVFNGDIVNSAKTFVDGFPAKYGGQLSSIVDIRTKDGNQQQIHGGISLGITTATTYLEGPIQKNKSSFLVSARRTWIDLPLATVDADPVIKFYDLNAKINFKLSKKDRLFFSFYKGKDTFKQQTDRDTLVPVLEDVGVIDWGNTAVSARWNHILNKQLFLNLTAFHSHFHFDIDYNRVLAVAQDENHLLYKSYLRQSAIKTDFDFLPNPRHHIRFGSRYHFLKNNTGSLYQDYIINGVRRNSSILPPQLQAQLWTLYVADEFQLRPTLSLHAGLRLENYRASQQQYWLPQARFQLNHSLSSKNKWGLAYSNMIQYAHLLDNASVESTNINWVLSNPNIRPATSDQLSLYFLSLITSRWKVKVTGYYKNLKYLRRFQQGEDILTSLSDWEKNTAAGEGKIYGMEVLLNKTLGNTQGWLSYTFSKSQRKFDNFAQQGYFPFQHDRRHVVNLTLTHQFPATKQRERQLSIVWTYAAGNWQTIPLQVFEGTNQIPLPTIEAINNYQLAASHRLDLSFFQKKSTTKGFQHTWNIGVYNAYGQNNPYAAEIQYSLGTNNFKLVANNLSVTPIPYITYGFRF